MKKILYQVLLLIFLLILFINFFSLSACSSEKKNPFDHENDECPVEQWDFDTSGEYAYAHDCNPYASDHFIVYSDGRNLESKRQLTEIAEEVFNEMAGMFLFFTENQAVVVRFHNIYELFNSTLEIVEYEGEGMTGGVTVGYLDSTTFNCGNSLSGEFSIQNAYITQRNPLNGDPMVINAEGKMSGTMAMIRPPDINITYPDFSGIINIPIVLMLGGSEEFYEYFENNCD